MRMLDLFCGRWGWSRVFASRGWQCVGVDLTEPDDTPDGCEFWKLDVLDIRWSGQFVGFESTAAWLGQFDVICASSPCEEFSVHEMKHFHPNPKYPEMGVRLFNHTRAICEASGLPYIMENVRPAQKFVGQAAHHCGPFYLWGNLVPPLMPQGITKGIDVGSSKAVKGMNAEEKRAYRAQFPWNQSWSSPEKRGRDTAKAATIPPLLANCVAEWAERMLNP